MKLSGYIVLFVCIIIAILLINMFFIQKPTVDIKEESKTTKCELYMNSTPEVLELPCAIADILEVDCEEYCEGLCDTSFENLKQTCLEWRIVNKNVSA